MPGVDRYFEPKRDSRPRVSSPPPSRVPAIAAREASIFERREEFAEGSRGGRAIRRRVGNVLLTGSLVVVDGNPFQLQIAVPMVDPGLVDAVLLGDHFPELQCKVAVQFEQRILGEKEEEEEEEDV